MSHVMIDIETTGTVPGCPILSIGACTLANSTEILSSFYSKIKIETCFAVGLKSDPATIKWWEEQSEEAKYEAFSGKQDLKQVLCALTDWLSKFKNPQLWANGSDFDFPILVAAYKACNLEVPWKYDAVNDYRTLRKLFPEITPRYENCMKHNALNDAIYQANHLDLILKEM